MIPSANPKSTNNFLKGVAPITSNDVWAVGYFTDVDVFKTLAMHWDGSGWTITPTSNPVTGANQLKKVVAIAPNDVWSVGGHGDSYVLRWNGTAWTQVPLPSIGHRGAQNLANFLEGIDAVSSNDIWAVGAVDSLEGGTWTLTMHWNGTGWTQIPSPNVTGPRGVVYSQELESVVAIASNNVWAVGHYRANGINRTLVQRWNGQQWSIVATPDGPTGDGMLHGIAAAGPNDIWAVGEYETATSPKALALHWDGTAWSVSAPPNPSPTGVSPLRDIVGRGPNDFYAVGSFETASEGLNTFVVHWDGASWTQSPSETPPGDGTGWNPLLDVGRDNAGQLWAVGKKQADFSSANLTLVQRAALPPAAPAATSIVSRKAHGTAGVFDIELPATGPIAVENRLPVNGEHVLVYNFSTDVTAVDGAQIKAGTATVASRAVGPNPNQYTVRLTGVSDLQHLVVQLQGVRGLGKASLASVEARMDVVIGDANGSRSVTASDIGLVKANVGASVDATNFRADVTSNGGINSSDVSAVKARSGGSL